MIRVLHIVGSLSNGGVETFIMNLYRNIDKSQVQFDFVIGSKYTYCQSYANEITRNGGKIFLVPKGVFGAISLRKIINGSEYRIIHSHRDAMSFFFLLQAKICGVKVRISHSHTTGESSTIKTICTLILKPLLGLVSTHRMACGFEAGNHLFGNKGFIVVPNAIDLDNFSYNRLIADEVRKEIGLDPNDVVFGHVGHFEHPKNHEFLIKIFRCIVDAEPRAKLVLIGSGTLIENIRELIIRNNIENKVVFLGARTDVNRILNSFDIVVFPSRFEGFSFAMVEMQANGLRILASDVIPPEINISGNVYFLPLEVSPSGWAEMAISLSKYVRDNIAIAKLKEADLDINYVAKEIQKIYIHLAKNPKYKLMPISIFHG